ncbi:hypothetical protein PAMP_009815 [Pampus punctatissimus]
MAPDEKAVVSVSRSISLHLFSSGALVTKCILSALMDRLTTVSSRECDSSTVSLQNSPCDGQALTEIAAVKLHEAHFSRQSGREQLV